MMQVQGKWCLLAPRLSALYPLEIGEEAKDMIYSPASNPSPVYDLLQEMFAMSLNGVVTVWAKDNSEMSSLLRTIKVIVKTAMNYPYGKLIMSGMSGFIGLQPKNQQSDGLHQYRSYKWNQEMDGQQRDPVGSNGVS